MILTLIYFFIALFLLITIHEAGHFLMARLCGVKVLRFSFGFGKVLLRCHDKRNTEYVWSLFPLGGYVKLLDESETEVAENERHLAFNNQSVWRRMAIIIAGPLFNFIFAFIALWLVWVIGMQSLAPIIQAVKPGSIAANAGLSASQEIISLDNNRMDSWRDFQFALMPFLGSEKKVMISVKSVENGTQKSLVLSLEKWVVDGNKTDLLESLGIKPFVPHIPPVVGGVLPESPAELAGLQMGDRIEALNHKPLTDWFDFVTYVKQHPNAALILKIKRKEVEQQIHVKLSSQTVNGQKEGYIGLRSQAVDWPAQWLRLQRQDPLHAMGSALKQTVNLTTATLSLIGRLVTDRLGFENISGPVGIAQGAGESGRSGFVYYLSFLALVSISLGVLNILPIPLLDGGHLLYCLLEIIRRRSLPDSVKSAGIYIGFVFMMALMVVALRNDLARLFH